MSDVYLKPSRGKSIRNRHPWIYSGAIQHIDDSPETGDVVNVHAADGELLAQGYLNRRSQIAVRLLSWDAQPITPDFWRKRLQAAISRRATLAKDPETDAYRLIFAESDGLPGLIVDRYGDWLVLQALTAGIDRRKTMLAEKLAELLTPRGILERSDVDVRSHEGLEPVSGTLWGDPPPETVTIRENGHRFRVDLHRGHKTGFYLDQRDNRAALARYCATRSLLNVFCYTGGFSVYAAAAGASRITNLDASRPALELAEANMALNDLPEPESWQGDAFQVLRDLVRRGMQYDVVLLDPPKFAHSRGQLQRATRGYKDINMLGMRLTRPGGLLATFSCSGHMGADLFQKVLFGAALDVGRPARIIERYSQGFDHPVLLSFPEGYYLKGLLLRID